MVTRLTRNKVNKEHQVACSPWWIRSNGSVNTKPPIKESWLETNWYIFSLTWGFSNAVQWLLISDATLATSEKHLLLSTLELVNTLDWTQFESDTLKAFRFELFTRLYPKILLLKVWDRQNLSTLNLDFDKLLATKWLWLHFGIGDPKTEEFLQLIKSLQQGFIVEIPIQLQVFIFIFSWWESTD